MKNEHDAQPGPGDIIQTEDGYRFSVLEDGSVTDGDMAWESVDQFRTSMADDPQGPIGWVIKHRNTVTPINGKQNSDKSEEASTADEKVAMVCSECGSTEVLADAYAEWDTEAQDWAVASTFEKGAHCAECDGDTRIDAVPLKRLKGGRYVDSD